MNSALTLVLVLPFCFTTGCISRSLEKAILDCDLSMVEEVLDKDSSLVNQSIHVKNHWFSLNGREYPPIVLATMARDWKGASKAKDWTKLVKLLIRKGAQLESRASSGHSALTWAAYKGHTDLIGILIENGARIKEGFWDDDVALFAAGRGDNEALSLLSKAGAELDQGPPFPIMVAPEHTVGYLVDRGVSPNRIGFNNMNLLHRAAGFKSSKLIEKLIGVCPKEQLEGQTVYGETPLYIAARNDNDTAVRLFLEAGASPNTIVEKTGYQPLHIVCECPTRINKPASQVVALLVKHGASTVKRTKDGRTALHLAIGKRRKGDIQRILAHTDTDVNAQIPIAKVPDWEIDRSGMTALDILQLFIDGKLKSVVSQQELSEIGRELRKHGAKTSDELGRPPQEGRPRDIPRKSMNERD